MTVPSSLSHTWTCSIQYKGLISGRGSLDFSLDLPYQVSILHLLYYIFHSYIYPWISLTSHSECLRPLTGGSDTSDTFFCRVLTSCILPGALIGGKEGGGLGDVALLHLHA